MPIDGPSLLSIAIFAVIGMALTMYSTVVSELPDERLKALRDEGGVDGATANRLLEERAAIRARLLAGRVLAVAGVSGFTARAVAVLGGDWILVAVGAAALLYAVFAEAAQSFARRNVNRVGLTVVRLIRPLEIVLTPLAWPATVVTRLAERLTTQEPPVPSHIAEREVEHVIEQQEEKGALPEPDAALLRNVLEMRDTVAREVMVPRTRTVAIDVTLTIDEVVARVLAEGHSRYPVYRERLDRIEGILHAKDLFQAVHAQRRGDAVTLSALLRKTVLFVPEAKRVGELLREMQQQRQHLAVVVDEFGGTSGVVTLEDILEEIVGEIHDEHDSDEALVREVEAGVFVVDARVSIHDLSEQLEVELTPSEEGFDSLGGRIVEELGKVPKVGEQLSLEVLAIEILEADERRVIRCRVAKATPVPPPPSSGTSTPGMPAARTSSP